MAIGIFKSLIFGDVNSADYGIYITGEAVYNAPERAVEMVTVPGRNGAIALDQGRWENIEVSYPAGCFGGDQSDFASKISDFRNAIVSQIGYQRLTDEYNPNEYRMAVYAEGLDVKPKSKGRAGEFTITFDCKPQRYLTSGETEITVESGDTLTNPTQYASSPLLKLTGYGTAEINGYGINIADDLVGNVSLGAVYDRSGLPYVVNFPDVHINSGDLIEISNARIYVRYEHSQSQTKYITNGSWDNLSGDWSSMSASQGNMQDPVSNLWLSWVTFGFFFSVRLKFYYGTPATKYISADLTVTFNEGSPYTFPVTIQVDYDGNKTITFTSSKIEPVDPSLSVAFTHIAFSNFVIYSSATTFGQPTYIDCDLGETYTIEDGVVSSLNKYISLGSDLPKLESGSNEVTFDNTITDFKIVPRWWKL